MDLTEPWSKKHKKVTKAAAGGVPFSLSNSFAQPLTHAELAKFSRASGNHALVEAYNDHTLEYTPNGGSQDLREEIAKLYASDAIQAENVLVFPGAQVALQTAALALAADCHSIVFAPGYQSTVEAARHAGGEVTTLRLRAENGWQVDPKEVAAAIRPSTRYMVLNEPYNPAGTLMAPTLQAELVAIAEAHGIRILSDEVYRLLEHDARDRLPAMADLYRGGISAVTLSKPWGGCGVTIGWLAFQDLSIKQRLVDVQYFGTACPSRASEIQAMMVLRSSDAILEKNLGIIRRNLALLTAFMSRYSDVFEWQAPKAGAIAFIRHRLISSEAFGEQLAWAGISIKPAYCFIETVSPDIEGYFRVGYGEEKMPKALAALTAFVEENRHAWRGEEAATRSRL